METPRGHRVKPSFLTLIGDYLIEPPLCLAEPAERLVATIGREHELACVLVAFADQRCKRWRDGNDVLGVGLDAVCGDNQRTVALARRLDLGPPEVGYFSKAACGEQQGRNEPNKGLGRATTECPPDRANFIVSKDPVAG